MLIPFDILPESKPDPPTPTAALLDELWKTRGVVTVQEAALLSGRHMRTIKRYIALNDSRIIFRRTGKVILIDYSTLGNIWSDLRSNKD